MIASVLIMCGCSFSDNKGGYAGGNGNNASGYSTADDGGDNGMSESIGFFL